MLRLRPYCSDDRQRVVEIFLLNTPSYFHPQERQDLEEYLSNEIEHYFVVEYYGKIVASGGCNIENNIGWLSWYIVHPQWHGKKIGSMLIDKNLEIFHVDNRVKRLLVHTSQLVYKFYAKFGYQLINTEKDYWGPGFDLYEMEKHNLYRNK
jgi:ribosomal-protein-alanine N-acetyltransferase